MTASRVNLLPPRQGRPAANDLAEVVRAVRARATELGEKLGLSAAALMRPRRARDENIRLGRTMLVYVCRHVDGLTYNDIAHALGVTYGSVYQLHAHACRVLASHVDEYPDEEC